MTRAYEEIVDFIAAGSRPGEIAAFEPSAEARMRVHDLLQREKLQSLTSDEAAELIRYLQLEHLMRLVKARARSHFASHE